MTHEPRAAWARLVVGASTAAKYDAFVAAATARPGIKARKNGAFQVPYNAIDVFAGLIEEHGCRVVRGEWVVPPPTVPSWLEVKQTLLSAGEIRPEYVEEFPRPHQIEGICRAWNAVGHHFWHATGGGKTFTAIVSATAIPGAVLIVTRSAARFQLAREVDRFTFGRAYVTRAEGSKKRVMTVGGLTWRQFFSSRMPELRHAAAVAAEWADRKEHEGVVVHVVDQTLSEYQAACAERGQRPWVVMGWESVLLHLDAVRKLAPSVLVFDEMHMGKSSKRYECVHLPALPDDPEEAREQSLIDELDAQSQGGFIKAEETFPGGPVLRKMFVPVINRASIAERISKSLGRKVIGLTATPVANRLKDLWGQLATVEVNAWGNKSIFETHYCDAKPGRFGGIDASGTSNEDELNVRLGRISHKVPAHVAQQHLLHLKRRQSVYVAQEDQVAPLAGLARKLKTAKKEGGVSRIEAELADACSRKRKAVIDMVDDHVGSGHKVCIFTARRSDGEDLGKRLAAARMGRVEKPQIWVADGDTPSHVRDQIIQDYMAHPGPCILVGTGQAFGESVNLDDTDAAFFVMLPYTPAELRQWEGRFVRLSMRRPVTIYYMIAEGTIDEHIASILIDKFPAVVKIADDIELGDAAPALAGFDPNETAEEFATAILADLDWE